MQRNKISLCQQFIHSNDLRRLHKRVIGHHLHANSLGIAGQRTANAAKTNDTQCLAGQLHALIFLLVPLTVTHGVVGDVNITGNRKHMAQRQLCHRIAAGRRSVAHLNALLLGVSHINIIHAHAAADNQFQASGRSCGVNHGYTHLGGRAHYQNIIIGQLFGQFISFIKLLDYLIAQLLQFGDGCCFHAVGGQNSYHNQNLRIYRN